MPLVIPCPSCKARLKAPENLIGKTVKCPNCQAAIPVRAAAATPAPAPAKVAPKRPAPPADDFDFDEPEERPAPRKGGAARRAREEYLDEPPRKSKAREEYLDEPPRKSKARPAPRDDFEDLERRVDDFPEDDDDDRPRKRKKGRAGGGPSGSTTEQDRQNGFMVYLAAILSGLVGFYPLGGVVWWLMKRGESRFVDHHGKELLNMVITEILAWILAMVFVGVGVGVGIGVHWSGFILAGLAGLCLAVYFTILFVCLIIAMFKAKAGEWYRFPLIMHMLKA